MPASFTTLTGVKTSNRQTKESFLDVNMPQKIFYQGKSVTGKGVARERCIEVYYDNGITCAELWAARNNENMFYAYNNNCQKLWEFVMKFLKYLSEQNMTTSDRKSAMRYMDMYNDEMFDFYMNDMIYSKWIKVKDNMIALTKEGFETLNDEPLHCNCNRAYPILFMVPDYVHISQESIDRFNKKYFWDYKEYQEAWQKGYVRESMEKSTNFWKVEKPQQLQTSILKVVYFSVPTATKKDRFIDQFARYLMQARDEHRILVQNPRMFAGDDKFRTLAAEINSLPAITQKHFIPLTEEQVGKPRYQWSKYELSYAKLAIGLGELKTIAPSHKLSGEQKSSDTKRALFDKIGEWTHWNMWLVGDYQNPEDLYSGVRYQSDYIVIKRASRNLLGSDFAWLFDDIEENRKKMYMRLGISEEVLEKMPWLIDKSIHTRVNKKWCRVQNLPDYLSIVTDIDNTFYYRKIGANQHHHKHRKDNSDVVFKLDITMVDTETGQVITADNIPQEDGDEEEKQPKTKKAKSKQEKMERMDYKLNTQHKTFQEVVIDEVGEQEWKNMSEKDQMKAYKRLWSQYDYWNNNTTKTEIEETFGHKGE